MKGDLLSEATRALRESVDGTSDGARATEERVLSLLPRKRRLRLVRPWGFSMAALLLGSSVWAMGGGAPIKSWLGRLTDSSEQREAAPSVEAPAKKAARTRRAASPAAVAQRASPEDAPSGENGENEVALGPESPVIEQPPPVVAVRAPSAPPKPLEPAAPPQASARPSDPPTASPPPETAGNAALDVYERAHDLHFKRRDYVSALAAWEQYLTLAPSGSLALEARFHRGVCLVRLGRSDEARRALEPFARGDYGTYRRAQAQKLLDEAR